MTNDELRARFEAHYAQLLASPLSTAYNNPFSLPADGDMKGAMFYGWQACHAAMQGEDVVRDAARYRQVLRSTMAQLSEWHRLSLLSQRHGGVAFDDSVDAAMRERHG